MRQCTVHAPAANLASVAATHEACRSLDGRYTPDWPSSVQTAAAFDAAVLASDRFHGVHQLRQQTLSAALDKVQLVQLQVSAEGESERAHLQLLGRWHGQPTRALRSRRRRLLGASAGARLLRFLAARPQTRLEAAAQRPGTPSARCKLHATPQVFSKWQKRWGPTHHSKLQPQEARTGGLGRGRAAPCSDGLAFSLRSWWQQTDHTQRRREALSLACHSWRRDQKLLAHGPPKQGCKHQPAVAVTGCSDCQIH